MRALGLAAFIAACSAPPPPARDVLSVSVEQASSWVRNFNPLLVGTARWPTRGGIYEPLLIWNAVSGAWVPWLATSYRWSDDHRRLTLTIRDGVRWSDGAPFSAEDVAFTFELLHRHRALDASGLWDFLDGVRAVDAHTVELTLSRPYVPGLVEVAQQVILPAHLWRRVADPVAFTNPNPVGTGPFTEVRVFRNQVWELGRNPRYWQPGKPEIAALRMVAYPSNDQANLALVEGEIDWAGNFVPAIERTFVARDREHHGYWFPALGSTVFLYPNTRRPPLDDVRVRKALSLAIDRQRVVDIGLFGYARPSDGTALSDAYASWRDPAVAASAWVGHDVAAAAALLDEAGWTRGADGVRSRAGRRLAFTVEVVSGWSDWVRAAQVIARDLAQVGVAVEVRAYEWSAWFERLQSGEFELSIACPGLAFSFDAPTPYYAYRWIMSSPAVKPLGELQPTNWNRFGDPRADALLGEFEATDEGPRQKELMRQIEERFAATAPAIPLFVSPLWGAFNTRRFTGFPSAANPYAKLSPHSAPENLLVLMHLQPRAR
ncbi:MAG: putative oligopeptide/dipeptide transporter, periplasmic oligopeptide/dipeptide-binding protein [Myxococcales bacterium]|nr:putative oligopeptide/dipeptide transporter, periplasmic oligopeptide/dipeptide-binding protein [Myxococcales bacterium]